MYVVTHWTHPAVKCVAHCHSWAEVKALAADLRRRNRHYEITRG